MRWEENKYNPTSLRDPDPEVSFPGQGLCYYNTAELAQDSWEPEGRALSPSVKGGGEGKYIYILKFILLKDS